MIVVGLGMVALSPAYGKNCITGAVVCRSVYLAGLMFRPRRRVLGMGVDSLAVLIRYVIGTAGLFAIALLSGKAG